MDLQLGGLTFLITGGSAGLGKALAQRLVAEGANVAICGRDEQRLMTAIGEIEGDVLAYRADVSDPGEIQAFVDATVKRFGAIDGVANNAGGAAGKPFDQVDDEQWAQDFELKIMAAVRVTRAALPHLRKSSHAAILNSLNATAKAPSASSLPSSLSRAAGLALTKAMANDFAADGIRVNAICTGIVKSEQWAGAAQAAGISEPEFFETILKRSPIPLGRVGETKEWANVAAFLLSPAASYVTGAAINVDGGLSPVV